VRGAEVTELLAALNTGHEGGAGTVHANSAGDVPARVEALALAAGLPRAAAHSQLAAALDAVVHVVRTPTGRRLLREVAVPVREASGLVTMATAVSFDDAGQARAGPGARSLDRRLAR
jgi:pilus assembly protein CpaF